MRGLITGYLLPGPRRCGEGQFTCQITRQCIPEWRICDGQFDCADKTDEGENICCKNLPFTLLLSIINTIQSIKLDSIP